MLSLFLLARPGLPRFAKQLFYESASWAPNHGCLGVCKFLFSFTMQGTILGELLQVKLQVTSKITAFQG